MIGRKDTLVAIERAAAVQNAYGEEVQTWATTAREWAAVFYGKGAERRQAAQRGGEQSATFQMWNNEVTRRISIDDRFNIEGALWDISGIAIDTPRRGEIEITAVSAGRTPISTGSANFSSTQQSGLLTLLLEDA